MDGTVDGNASTNFCLVGETENLDSSPRPLAPALRERYCKSNRIACQSGSSRFAVRKRMPVGMKFARSALWDED